MVYLQQTVPAPFESQDHSLGHCHLYPEPPSLITSIASFENYSHLTPNVWFEGAFYHSQSDDDEQLVHPPRHLRSACHIQYPGPVAHFQLTVSNMYEENDCMRTLVPAGP